MKHWKPLHRSNHFLWKVYLFILLWLWVLQSSHSASLLHLIRVTNIHGRVIALLRAVSKGQQQKHIFSYSSAVLHVTLQCNFNFLRWWALGDVYFHAEMKSNELSLVLFEFLHLHWTGLVPHTHGAQNHDYVHDWTPVEKVNVFFWDLSKLTL